jgi:hypothetical protein
VGKGKCCGASLIIFTPLSIEMQVLRATKFWWEVIKIAPDYRLKKKYRKAANFLPPISQ